MPCERCVFTVNVLTADCGILFLFYYTCKNTNSLILFVIRYSLFVIRYSHMRLFMSTIHPTAIISPKAELDSDVDIGPHVIIDEHVSIGSGTRVMAGAYLTGYTSIGVNNKIHMGAVVGHDPQDFAFDTTIRSFLKIGNNNVIREYCTIHRGTKPESATVIGNDNFFMGGTHVGHNCRIGNNVITANYSMFGGYVSIGDGTFVSGGVGVHQFVSIGRLAMLSGNGGFSHDIPPFVNALERNHVAALNLVGMKRAGVTREAIKEVKEAYFMLYLAGDTRRLALEKLDTAGFVTEEAAEFVAFVKSAKRPLVMHRKG